MADNFLQRIGGILSDTNLTTRERLENQILRQEIKDKARRKEIAGLLAEQMVRPSVDVGRQTSLLAAPDEFFAGQTPAQIGQARIGAVQSVGGLPVDAGLLGLVAEAAPEQVISGVLAQQFAGERAEPSRIREIRAAGFDPRQPEIARAILAQALGLDPTGGLAERAELELLRLSLDAAREERVERRESRTQEAATTSRKTFSDLNSLRRLAELNEKLSGTFISKTGIVPDNFRRLALTGLAGLNALGLAQNDAEAILADLQEFDAVALSLVLESLDIFAGQGAVTNTKFQSLLRTKPDLGKVSSANNRIIANFIEAIISAAEVTGTSVPELAEFKALARRLRGGDDLVPVGDLSNEALLRELQQQSGRR